MPTELDPKMLITNQFIEQVRSLIEVPVTQLTVEDRNESAASIDQAKIDALDKEWRAEREVDDQPLITSVLSSPLSSYLIRIQALSVGLYSAIFVMDKNGLNAGQSAITSDYWQGDEAKFQKTYDVSADAVFIDEPEYSEETATWVAQLNMTIKSASGAPIGAVTVDVNLNELARRHAAGVQ
ncbi:MAG: PDC sensor domain-containing protein [Alphaproteobacteria bacterium]|nr:PDC sensor domain-containing protein [Alphaproteobacteria bacterium]